LPDVVLSGHVHDYQRFIKSYPGHKSLTYIVAGAGGYADLHAIAQPNDPDFPDQSTLLDDVALQNYCTHTHGFLKLAVTRQMGKMQLKGEYFTVSHQDEPTRLFDSFVIDINLRSR
jgi:acid phosphatase type 7